MPRVASFLSAEFTSVRRRRPDMAADLDAIVAQRRHWTSGTRRPSLGCFDPFDPNQGGAAHPGAVSPV